MEWMHHRFWCDQVIRVCTLSASQVQLEHDFSYFYFRANTLIVIRNEIRKQWEIIFSSRKHQIDESILLHAIDAVEVYKPHLKALLTYAQRSGNQQDSARDVAIVCRPPRLPHLFSCKLLREAPDEDEQDEFVQMLSKEMAMLQFALVWLRSLIAESWSLQASTDNSIQMLNSAEIKWKMANSSFLNFTRSERDRTDHMKVGFLEAYFRLMLISLKVSRLYHSDLPPEKKYCLCSAYSRRAITVCTELVKVSAQQKFYCKEEVIWLFQDYTVRWKTVFYTSEMHIYNLRNYSHIAHEYNKKASSLVLAPLTENNHRRDDAYYTQIRQELRLLHQMHLTSLLDEKQRLLSVAFPQTSSKSSISKGVDVNLPQEIQPLYTISVVDNFHYESDGVSDEEYFSINALVEAISGNVNVYMEEQAVVSTEVQAKLKDAKYLSDHSYPQHDDTNKSRRGHAVSRPVSADSRLGTKKVAITNRPSSAHPSSQSKYRNPSLKDETFDDYFGESNEGSTQQRRKPSSTSPTWIAIHMQCALCEVRMPRSSLLARVVRKRIVDLRKQWGVVLNSSKRFKVASAMYDTVHVCLMCEAILKAYTEEQFVKERARVGKQLCQSTSHARLSSSDSDDVGKMIHASIIRYSKNASIQSVTADQKNYKEVTAGKRARQSSTMRGYDARNAIQNDAVRPSHTKEEKQPWWEVDLGNYFVINSVRVHVREPSVMNEDNRDIVEREMYPIYIILSMKSGIGRDLDDILAGSITYQEFERQSSPTIVWSLPPNARGRFIRIQVAGFSALHLEYVNAFIEKISVEERQQRQQKVKHQLKRAAFRATLVTGSCTKAKTDTPEVKSQKSPREPMVSAFLDPEKAEKKRMSRLYAKFKGLLEARAQHYVVKDDQNDDGTDKQVTVSIDEYIG